MRNVLTTIAIVIVGGVVLLFVEYNVFEGSEKTRLIDVPAENARPQNDQPRSRETNDNPSNSESPPRQLDSGEDGSSSSNDHSIRVKLDLAKEIFSKSQRDKALKIHLDSALQATDLRVAIDVAEEIFSKSSRDQALIRIVGEAISRRDIQTARAAVGKIFGRSTRDSQIRRILETSDGAPRVAQ